MARTAVKPVTGPGVEQSAQGPWPSCPLRFDPQVHTVPSLLSARLCELPPFIDVAPVKPITPTGAGRWLPLVPSPTWPDPLSPQALGTPERPATVGEGVGVRVCGVPVGVAVAPGAGPTMARPW